MQTFIPLLLLVFTSLSASAEIFTWKDENGVTHFSEEKPYEQEAESIIVEEKMPVSLTPPPSREVEKKVTENAPEAEINTATEVEKNVSEVQNVNSHNMNNPAHDAAHKPTQRSPKDVKEKVQDIDMSKIDKGTQTISKGKISNANAEMHDAISK